MEKLKNWLWGLGFFAVAGWMAWDIVEHVSTVLTLAKDSEYTVGTVVNSEGKPGGKFRAFQDFQHELEYLDTKGRFPLESQHKSGSEFWILYSTSNPDIALIDPNKEGVMAAAWNEIGFAGLFAPLLAVFMTFLGVQFFRAAKEEP
jgi:hypothetical protein